MVGPARPRLAAPLVAAIRLNDTATASLSAGQREVGPGDMTQAIEPNLRFLLGGRKRL